MTFKLISSLGRAHLEALGSSTDNWPECLPEGTGKEQDNFWSASAESSILDQSSNPPPPYRFRNRWVCSSEEDIELRIDEVTLGHPAAHGCKACFELRIPCGLLYEGSKYPCRACVEDSTECELIIQPSKKRACEHCRRRRIVCSYREGGDHSLPCTQCAGSDLNCIAGPQSGRTRVGPSLDQDPLNIKKILTLPRRTFVSCTECQRANKWCSFKKERQEPCKQCSESGTACTFEPLGGGAATEKPRNTKDCKLRESSHEQVPPNAEELPKPTAPKLPTSAISNQAIGGTQFIMTRLAHPITFNYESLDENETLVCHWCDDIVYGLLGIGEVRVKVVDYQDGNGYTEVQDGHTAEGHLPSRMCASCTLDRLMIVACKPHEMQPLLIMDPEKFDCLTLGEYIMPEMASSAPFEWCSICPSPAFYACCRKVNLDDGGDGDESPFLGDVNGCGLRLCVSCTVGLVGEHEGVLEGLIDQLRLEEGDAGFGLRADVDFLHPHGELLRRAAVEEGEV